MRILWDQLSQKCKAVQEEATSSNTTLKQLELPEVQGVLLGEPHKYDICIAFSFKNGETLAKCVLWTTNTKVVDLCNPELGAEETQSCFLIPPFLILWKWKIELHLLPHF